ncbi:MAG: hypothetical protein DLM50_01020 [Candidatus Meridianibacter frigidus]|nr:MAG: hypothetical protein DLM50_01020 [Candidatus Eremiobacteraeota bacterium]
MSAFPSYHSPSSCFSPVKRGEYGGVLFLAYPLRNGRSYECAYKDSTFTSIYHVGSSLPKWLITPHVVQLNMYSFLWPDGSKT